MGWGMVSKRMMLISVAMLLIVQTTVVIASDTGASESNMTPEERNLEAIEEAIEASDANWVAGITSVSNMSTEDAKKTLYGLKGFSATDDERVIEEFADEVFSIGDYILTGGELASLVICDAVSRNIDGVLGNSDSLSVESFESPLLEAPSFSKPKDYKNNMVPSEYLKGNHSKIRSLKLALSECKTKFFRPEQLLKHKVAYKK